MSHEQLIIVDADGRRGSMETFDPAQEKTLLRFDGRQLLVPTSLLQRQAHDTYFLPLSLSALDEKTGEIVVLPVIAEEAVVRKRPVEKERLRVSTRVEEHEALIDELLLTEDVAVERVPVNRPLSAPVAVRQEGDTIIVPIMAETLEVRKLLTLVEEVHIVKRKKQVPQTQTVDLRRQTVHVEHLEPDGTPGAGDGP